MKYSRPFVYHALYRGFGYTVAVIMCLSRITYCDSVSYITHVQKLSPETRILLMVHCIVYEYHVVIYHDSALLPSFCNFRLYNTWEFYATFTRERSASYGSMIVISSSGRCVFSFVGCCNICQKYLQHCSFPE